MRVLSRDTDGLLFALDEPEDAERLASVLDRFRSLSPEPGAPFWKQLADDDGRPLFATVARSKAYVLFTRNDDGSLRRVVKFTEHALAGAVADPPRLAGRGRDGKHHWARRSAEAAAANEIASRSGKRRRTFQAPWDEPGEPAFPVLTRLQAAVPEHLSDLRERLWLKPFGCYVRANSDPAFGVRGSFVALDPGTDVADWPVLDWRDETGRPSHPTTTPGRAGSVLLTLAARTRRWLKPRPKPAPTAVRVLTVRRAGRAGPDVEAAALDPEADPQALRVFYDDESAAGVQRLAVDLGPRAFARMTGLSPSAAFRLARTGKPTASMVRRALAGLGRADELAVEVSCRCGRPLRRPNAKACSPACKQRAYRERQAASA